MKDIFRFYRLGCAILGIAILCLSGCKEDRFRIRVAPGSDVCMESLLSINSGTLQGSAASESGLGLPELKALALDKDNLKRAIGGRAYILHFYKRLEDKDEEISPVKFPFYWEIDSTKLQTEGTYLVDIQSASELKIAFRCEDCQLIDAAGQSSPGKKAGFESEFDSPTQARHCNEDACFALRPRKLDLSPEVGKQYLVRIESQQTYLTAAEKRIEVLESSNKGSYKLRFSDPLDYRAKTFLRELGIAMALADKASRYELIQPRIENLDAEIDSLRVKIATMSPGRTNPKEAVPEQWQKQLTALETEKVELQMEGVSILPRILVISPGIRCSGK